MKKVLVLTSTFPRWKNDTTPPFVYTLSKLISKNYNIIVLAPHSHKASKYENIGNMNIQRYQYFISRYQKLAYNSGIIHNVKNSFLAKIQIPFFLTSQFLKSNKLLLENNIELIHSHWLIPQGFIGVILKLIYNKPLIVTIHGSGFLPLKNKQFRKLQDFILYNANVITINSLTAKRELINRFPNLNQDKIKLIPMGIDLNIFKPTSINNKDTNILFVGRIVEQKGLKYLIKAIKKINDKNIKLLIIGKGPYINNLKQLIKSLNIENQVEFLGSKNQKEISHYYNLADIFVLPSVTTKTGTEALGLVLVEAMACKTPVIGSSSGGIKDIIKDNETGLIFQEKNSDELANKILEILNNNQLKNKIINNGFKFSKNNFDWKIISNKFIEIYDNLIK
tara:strand:+ start:391 stop:1572 length:1182 start_codon:yes stop_codon:yes gene_type:complete